MKNLILLMSVLLMACSEQPKSVIELKTNQIARNESATYYRAFDPYRFIGIKEFSQNDPISYPYVEAYKSKNKISQLNYYYDSITVVKEHITYDNAIPMGIRFDNSGQLITTKYYDVLYYSDSLSTIYRYEKGRKDSLFFLSKIKTISKLGDESYLFERAKYFDLPTINYNHVISNKAYLYSVNHNKPMGQNYVSSIVTYQDSSKVLPDTINICYKSFDQINFWFYVDFPLPGIVCD